MKSKYKLKFLPTALKEWKKLDSTIQVQFKKKLKDMNYPGSNLHKLTGDEKDQYAVKVSGNWRVFLIY